MKEMYQNGRLINEPQSMVILEKPADEWIPTFKAIDLLARKMLTSQYRILLSHEFEANTIAYAYFTAMLKYLRDVVQESGDTSATLNFMDMFEISVDYRANEDAEKEGNLTPMIVPGYVAKLALKSDALTEDN